MFPRNIERWSTASSRNTVRCEPSNTLEPMGHQPKPCRTTRAHPASSTPVARSVFGNRPDEHSRGLN